MIWTAACGSVRAGDGERIIFSSNRGGAGASHLWTIALTDGRVQPLTSGSHLDRDPRVSPDGRLVAFTRTHAVGTSFSSIWIRSLVTGGETRITADRAMSDTLPFWSPDGRMLGFVRASILPDPPRAMMQRLWTVTLARTGDGVRPGAVARLADVPANSADWNPVTGADLLIMRQEPEGWAPFSIVRLPYPPTSPAVVIAYDGRGHYWPVYSPDGRRFAFVRVRREIDLGELYVANADGSEETRVACAAGWILPAWSPDGRELVAVRSTVQGLWRVTVPPPGGTCSDGVQMTRGAFQDTSPTWASPIAR